VTESTTPAAPVEAPSPATVPAAHEHAAAVGRMRRSSLGALLLLLVQAILGMWAALYGRLPDSDKGKGLPASFGDAMSHGPASVAAHAGFGLLLFLDACVVVVFALTVRHAGVRLASVLGWLCIAGAATAGAASVNEGGAKPYSLTMAVLTFVAVACYAVNLYALGGEKR
jgi:heme A synthase